MKIKFIFKTTTPSKANDGVRPALDLEQESLSEQLEYWRDKLFDYERHGGTEEEIAYAKERLTSYEDLLYSEEEYRAEDMAMRGSYEKNQLAPATMNMVVGLLRKFLRRDIPVMLTGYSGFGKSEIATQAAISIPGFPVDRENVLDIRAGMMNVEDLRGIPMLVKNDDPEKAFTQSTIPSWLKKVILNTDKNFVLFFDEINHASASVLNSLYGLILERQLEEFKFKERVRIIAAGNTSSENEDLTELSTPLRNRLEIISIDKAVENDPGFFENYLRDKYKQDVPMVLIDALFDPDIDIGNSRDIEKLLKAWKEDIADNDPILTTTGAIPDGLYAKLQKIYQQQIYKPTGSEGHKDTIKLITEFMKKLVKQSPEYFNSDMLGYKVADLMKGNIKAIPFKGSKLILTSEGKTFVKSQFKDAPEELVEAALDKLAKG